MSGVDLGINFPPEDVSRIREILSEKYPKNVVLRQAVRHPSDFAINYIPITPGHESPGAWRRRVIVREVAEPLASSAASVAWVQIMNGNEVYGVVKVASTPESVPSLLLAIKVKWYVVRGTKPTMVALTFCGPQPLFGERGTTLTLP